MADSSSPNNGRSGGGRRGPGRNGWSSKSGGRGGWTSKSRDRRGDHERRGGDSGRRWADDRKPRRDGGRRWDDDRKPQRKGDADRRWRDDRDSRRDDQRRRDFRGNRWDDKDQHDSRRDVRKDGRGDGHRDDRSVDNTAVQPTETPASGEPMAPLDFDEKALPAPVRAELRGVPADTAHIIEGHLVAAAELLDEDPAQANAHAQAARRRAPRLPILREVAAEAAYQAGEYASALNDYRALRRMTGNDNFLPVIADCERALGRPQAALRLICEGQEAGLNPAQQIELVLVQAGARRDLGQRDEAVRLLREAVKKTLKLLLRRLRACTTPTPRRCWRRVTQLALENGSSQPRDTILPTSSTARTALTSLMVESQAGTLLTTCSSSKTTMRARRQTSERCPH
ncbi:tetratricopeptide repeat protein [Cutibacterium acnes JCM 18916]|nr:tetratricopeptide repeat protein [Cutibacterium acnes JCM 18916]